MRSLAKRVFLLLCFCIAVLCGIVGYAYFIEPHLLTVTSLSVQTEKEITPCKIVFFSDTHFGKHYDESHVDALVRKINERNPDIIIFGGDLFDNYARDRESMDLTYLQQKLSELQAGVAKYAVWGNHDYGGGAVRIYDDFITSCGFTLLHNESRLLEGYGIKIFGYDDYLMGWTDPSLYQIKSSYLNLIAAHEPIISGMIESSSENLLLSGHTHGGQVTIPFLTDKLLPEGSGVFTKGFFSAEEIGTSVSLQMYVSSGIGMTRYPFRFLNIPEIVEIQLSPAP